MQEADNGNVVRKRSPSLHNNENDGTQLIEGECSTSAVKKEEHFFILCCLDVVSSSCKRFQYKLYLTLFLSQLLPTIYKTVRIFYLGDLPNSSGVNIASQLVWVNLILEVFQEGLILPLYHLIGKSINSISEIKNKFKIGVFITFSLHFLLALLIFVLAEPLTKLMGQQHNTVQETVHYIRFELISIPFESVNQICVVVMTIFNWQKHLYAILILRLFLTIISDTFFLSNFHFSLHFGVIGIAYGNIITSLVICMYCILTTFIILKMKREDIFKKSAYSFLWLKDWFNVGFFSGLDSFIRNLFYIFCVIRMMNVIEKQAVYWRSNEFIWNWLLLPFLPLSNLLKQDTGNVQHTIDHKKKMTAYFTFTLLITVIWAISIPVFKYFFHYVMNVGASDVDAMYDLVLILFPFYIVYMVNTLFDSVLYGKGKTSYLALQSFLTNVIINVPLLTLFFFHVYKPTVTNVALRFGASITFDNCITMFLYARYIKTIGYNI